MTEKERFIKGVTILIDSREKEIAHITAALDQMGIAHETRKLDVGDYSFCIGGRDFSLSCVIERKNDPDEIYSNITEKGQNGQANRLEKEITAGSRALKQFSLLIEGVASMEELKAFTVPDWKMKMSPQRKVKEIGKTCHATMRAWQTANRHAFRVEFVKDKKDTAVRIVEEFYYYYHNYKALIASRG